MTSWYVQTKRWTATYWEALCFFTPRLCSVKPPGVKLLYFYKLLTPVGANFWISFPFVGLYFYFGASQNCLFRFELVRLLQRSWTETDKQNFFINLTSALSLSLFLFHTHTHTHTLYLILSLSHQLYHMHSQACALMCTHALSHSRHHRHATHKSFICFSLIFHKMKRSNKKKHPSDFFAAKNFTFQNLDPML